MIHDFTIVSLSLTKPMGFDNQAIVMALRDLAAIPPLCSTMNLPRSQIIRIFLLSSAALTLFQGELGGINDDTGLFKTCRIIGMNYIVTVFHH